MGGSGQGEIAFVGQSASNIAAGNVTLISNFDQTSIIGMALRWYNNQFYYVKINRSNGGLNGGATPWGTSYLMMYPAATARGAAATSCKILLAASEQTYPNLSVSSLSAGAVFNAPTLRLI